MSHVRPQGPWALEFARLAVPDLAASVAFYEYHVGLQPEQHTESFAFLRAGTSHHVIELVADTSLESFECLALGFSVASAEVLEDLRRRVDAAGHEVLPLHERTAACVSDGFAVRDPNGQIIELFIGFQEYAEGPLLAWKPQMIVHPFLSTPVYTETQDFYMGVLGFLASDYIVSDGMGASTFLRSENRYHHSLALRRDSSYYLAHLCFLMDSFDHVMRGRARALYKQVPIASDLVNHSASGSIAFYLFDPKHGPRLELCDGHRVFGLEQHESHVARRMSMDPRNIDVWRAAADDWGRF